MTPLADLRAAGPAGPFGLAAGVRDDGVMWAPGQAPAGRVLTVAEDQAAAITHEALENAAAIRQAAEQDAAAIRQQAVSRASAIQQEATDHATAVRQAAEQEAADMKAALLAMSGELGRAAAYVTENLVAPVRPAARPLALPAPRPAAEPLAPAAEPVAPPVTRPATRPARPDVRPAKPARSRQAKAFRLATIGAAGLAVFAITAGSAEIATHGYKFFVFRQGGTGSTGGSQTDQQFLDQEASGGHHAAKAHPAATAHKAVPGKGRHALEPGHTFKARAR